MLKIDYGLDKTKKLVSTTKSTSNYAKGTKLERAGATMEKKLEVFFTNWGMCKTFY